MLCHQDSNALRRLSGYTVGCRKVLGRRGRNVRPRTADEAPSFAGLAPPRRESAIDTVRRGTSWLDVMAVRLYLPRLDKQTSVSPFASCAVSTPAVANANCELLPVTSPNNAKRPNDHSRILRRCPRPPRVTQVASTPSHPLRGIRFRLNSRVHVLPLTR